MEFCKSSCGLSFPTLIQYIIHDGRRLFSYVFVLNPVFMTCEFPVKLNNAQQLKIFSHYTLPLTGR